VGGERTFDEGLTEDPLGWTMKRLEHLKDLLIDAGAADVSETIDYSHYDRTLPFIKNAIEFCL
jgi:hypothetical protein